MKKLFYLVLVMTTIVACCTSCSLAVCEAGEECVFVKQPWFFGSGGVSEIPLKEGSEWCVTTTNKVYVKITPMQYQENLDDIISNENTPLDFNSFITLQVESGKTPVLIKNFGEEWYENNIQEPYRNLTRHYVSQYSPFDLTSNREVIARIDSIVTVEVNKLISKKNMPVKVISVITGRAIPNQKQLDEMNSTAAQVQAKQTQDRRYEMELSRMKAEEQRAESDKAYQKTMGLTADQFVQLKAWDIIKDKQGANIDVLFNADGTDKMWNVRR